MDYRWKINPKTNTLDPKKGKLLALKLKKNMTRRTQKCGAPKNETICGAKGAKTPTIASGNDEV